VSGLFIKNSTKSCRHLLFSRFINARKEYKLI
jgi:hypothetical protein